MSDIDEDSEFEDIEKRRTKSSSYQEIGVKDIRNENEDEIMQERVLTKRRSPAEFLSTNDVLAVLRNSKDMILPNIPNGIKENIRYIVCNIDNVSKRNEGKRSVFFEDCGIWDASKRKVFKSHFSEDGNELKSVFYRKDSEQKDRVQRNRSSTCKYRHLESLLHSAEKMPQLPKKNYMDRERSRLLHWWNILAHLLIRYLLIESQ